MTFAPTKHVDYERWIARWTKAHDFLRGGLHVLRPTSATAQVRFFFRSGNSNGETDKPQYEVREQYSYLLSHPRESFEVWVDRHERAEHFPVLRPIVSIFASSLFRVAPTRTLNGEQLDDDWKAWVDDVDGNGRSLGNLSRAAVAWGLTFGRCFAVTEMPRVPADQRPRSEAERKQRRIEPYTYLITPMELVDWAVDRAGIVWAVIEETVDDDRAPGTPPPKDVEKQYRVWTRDKWQVYRRARNDKGKMLKGWEVYDEDTHGLGFVPIQPFFADKTEGLGTFESDSPIASVLDIDFAVFNLLSLLDEQEYQSTFPQLTVEDDGSNAPIETGPTVAMSYPQGGQRPEYISPDPDVANGLWQRILARIDVARKAGLVSRGAAENSIEQRSADALGVEFQDRYALLAGLADGVEDLEEGVMRHRAAWLRKADRPRSQYPRTFDLRSIQQQINNALQVNALPVGPRAKQIVNAHLIDRMLADAGVADAQREEAVKDALSAEIVAPVATPAQQVAVPQKQPEQPTPQAPSVQQ